MNYSRRQLEALGEPLGDCVTRKEGGRVIYGGGGGGSSAPATQTQVSDLPDWAKPYAQETLEKTKQLSAAPYQAYGAPRIAGFSPMQQRAQETAYNMGTAGQLGTGTGLATAAGLMGLGAGYQPGMFRNQFRAPEAYQPSQFAMLQAQAPELQQFQMGPPERVAGGQYAAPMMETAQTGYRPDLQMFQMAGPERVRTGSFTRPGTAAQYMSPFIEQALAPQLREAQRSADIAATQRAGQAVQQGAFGGSRAGLLEAEAQRNLATQMGDIRARGLQTAYEQAQQLYGTEAQRQLAAQQANQQAMLQAGGQNLQAALGVQQLGAQTGLQAALANLSAQQQANVQNQAAQLQTQGLTAQQAMQAALANQQAGLTTGQQNLAALLGVQQLGAGQSMQAQLANQQALQAAQQAAEQSRQYGYGQGMTAAQQRAQFGQAAQQLAEQSRQYGAGYGLQGLGTALQAAGQLGNLGQAEFGQTKDIIGLQSQMGAQQQALRQQGLTQAYQDFLNEQNYPYKQLGFMSDMIRGLPLGQQSTKQIYEPPGSMLGQLGGIGMGLYGLSRMGAFAEGGQVDEYADGGSVTSRGNVENILDDLSEVQLQQSRLAALNRGDKARLELIDAELAERASLHAGLGGAFDSLPAEDQERVFTAAGGGIVAFANGGAPFVQPLEEEESLAASRVSKKTRPAPRARTRPSAPNPSIAQAVEQMADKVGVNRETFLDKFEQLRNEFNASSKEEMKSLLAEAEKTMGGSKEVKERAFGEAVAKYGFEMARAASKRGATFLSSVSEAAPTLSSSLAESAKLAREMDQNDMKLRLNMKQFEIAQRKGDMQTAAALAGQIRADTQAQAQLGLQRQQLDETIRANKAKEGISAQRYSAMSARAGETAMRVKAQLAGKAAKQATEEWNNPLTSIELKKQYPSRQAYQKSLFEQMWAQSMPLNYAGEIESGG